MLEHLFGSRTRVKLISLFLSQPDEPMFVREVTRRIDTQINAVRRELANLIAFGLIIETDESDGEEKRPGLKRKYYKLNAGFPLLPEVRSLMTKAQLLVEYRVDKSLESIETVKYAALMGAFLGKAKAPVDLFIIGSIDKASLAKIVAKMEQTIGTDVNYTVMPVSEFEYRKSIADKFLTSIVESPKNMVVDRMNDPSLT
jgi:predicted transcriptional regulator